jgi:hypothetical protein
MILDNTSSAVKRGEILNAELQDLQSQLLRLKNSSVGNGIAEISKDDLKLSPDAEEVTGVSTKPHTMERWFLSVISIAILPRSSF